MLWFLQFQDYWSRLRQREGRTLTTLSDKANEVRLGCDTNHVRAALGRGAERGFTLVELLIALVLIAIITVLMFSGLRLGSRAWESVEAVSDRAADLRITHNFIQRTLRQARDVSVVVDAMRRRSSLAMRKAWNWWHHCPSRLASPASTYCGSDSRMAASILAWSWPAGCCIPEVLEGGDDYPAWEPLIDDSAPFGDNGALDSDMASGVYGRTLLLPEVADFELAYFGIAEGEQDPEWRQEWIEQPGLPLKVRLWVTTPRQSWPATVVELPGGGESSFLTSGVGALGQPAGPPTPPRR